MSPSGTSTGSASVNKTTDPGRAGDGAAPVLAVVSDLFFVARIRETGRLAGVRVEFARSPAEIEASLAHEPRFVLVDLTAATDYERLFAALAGARARVHDPRARPANSALARAVRSRRDEGDTHPGAAAADEGRSHRMTAQEFVRQLDGENQRRLGALAPADTLKPEVEGDLNVLN